MAVKEMSAVNTYVVPKVNLLPPEIAERKAQQRSYVIMGAVVAAAMVVVAFMYMGQAARVGKAKETLAASQAKATKLKGERTALQPVQDAYANVDAHEAMLAQALATRVRWSRFLHDLQTTIPDRVWITSFTATVNGPTPTNSNPLLKPGVGTVTFAGTGYAHDDVAAWLESLTKVKGYTDPYFTNSAVKPSTAEGGRPLVEFSSTVTLTSDAITPTDKAGTK